MARVLLAPGLRHATMLRHPRSSPSCPTIDFRYTSVRHFRLVSAPPASVDKSSDDKESGETISVPPPLRLRALPPPLPERVLSAVTPAASEHSSPTSSESTPSISSDAAETIGSSSASSSASSSPSPSSTSVPDESEQRVEEWKQQLHKHYAYRKQEFDCWSRELGDKTSKNLSLLGRKINEVTGYREVERLKQAVKDREADLALKRAETKSAKLEYEQAVLTRSTSQQNVNSLLERKHSWSDNDVAEFTKLVRSDHASRHAVTTTSNDMKQAELSVDKAFTALMQSILERYHEEQVWSDKIRSVSTWASIVALAANLIVFVGAMAFVEPWKRRRLVQGLEERMTGMMDRVEGELRVLSANVAELHAPLAAVPETSSVSAEPASLDVVAVDDSDSPPSSPPVADDVPPDTSAISDLSPIEMLSERAPAESQQSRTLGWISAQLSHLAPPTIERDLAAAGLVGAVGGAVTVGLVSLIVTSFRG